MAQVAVAFLKPIGQVIEVLVDRNEGIGSARFEAGFVLAAGKALQATAEALEGTLLAPHEDAEANGDSG